MGEISGLYGVRGWVRVFSYTQPRENIVNYSPWTLQGPADQRRVLSVIEGKAHGKGVVARLEGVTDRDAAAALMGWKISIPRSLLPDPDPGQYYWNDLVGLEVEDTASRPVGQVTGLMETGAHDVLVIQGPERILVPFVPDQTVVAVDLQRGVIVVDLPPEQEDT